MVRSSKGNSDSHEKERLNVPNGRFLLDTIGLSRDRLNAGRRLGLKVPVPAQLLKELLTIAASTLPFDLDFYLATYPDIKKAYDSGLISDPRTHFIQEGYIEGRFGSKPDVDEKYYTTTYADVRAVINAGSGVASALDHYLQAGVFEGRFPNPEGELNVKQWNAILGR
jgi:hypothetical protein